MAVAGRAGTTVGIMATGMATATLATKAMVAGATVSQDMPVSAGVAAAAGIAVDMAVVAMAAAAIADDQEVRS
jgi:hypothetical protein